MLKVIRHMSTVNYWRESASFLRTKILNLLKEISLSKMRIHKLWNLVQQRLHGRILTRWLKHWTESTTIWWVSLLLSSVLRPLWDLRITWFFKVNSKENTLRDYIRSTLNIMWDVPTVRVTRQSLKKMLAQGYTSSNARHVELLNQSPQSRQDFMQSSVVRERRPGRLEGFLN